MYIKMIFTKKSILKILLLLSFFSCLASSASASEPSVITVTPSAQVITPGQPFTIDISIDPSIPITGAQFDLQVDQSLVTITGVDEGDLFNQNGADTFFGSGAIDNDAGTVTDVFCSILGSTSVSSTGVMATISLTAESNTGISTFDLSGVVISDASSTAASYTIVNANVLVDTVPVLNAIGARSIDEEGTLSFTISATDADNDNMAYSATGLPGGANFDNASGVFTWTPSDGQAGSYMVTFEVTDGYLTDSEVVTITVNEVDHSPVITTFEPANGAVFDETDVITISADASDVDGDTLSYTIKIDGVTRSTGPSYSWTTDYSSAGAHTIEVTVSDGTNEATSQHTITINNVHPRWDVNEDGSVDILDVTMVSQKYGTSLLEEPYPRWDINQDGSVNIQDLVVIGYHFGETGVE